MGDPLGQGPTRPRGRTGRRGGVLVAAVLGLAVLPGTAAAAPSDEVIAAEQAARAASEQVGQLLAEQGAAQAELDRAGAAAADARAELEARQQAHAQAEARPRRASPSTASSARAS